MALVLTSRVALPSLSLLFPLQLAIAVTFSTAMHEAGHAVAAICAGFRLLMFGVWPIMFVRTGTSWRLCWIGARRAGFIVADPIVPTNLPRRLAILVAAGPAASFATGLAAVFLQSIRPMSGFTAQLNLIAFFSLLAAILNLLPSSSRLVVTDGQRLRMLAKADSVADRYCCLLLLMSASRSGVRPRDLNGSLIDRLPGPLDGSPDSWLAQLFRYNWLIDNARLDEADDTLMWLLREPLPPPLKQNLQLQASWFEARFRGSLAAARHWMDASPIRKTSDDNYCCTLARAKAGIAFLEGRWTDAQTAAAEALHHADRIADAGSVKLIRENLIQFESEIATRAAALQSD